MSAKPFSDRQAQDVRASLNLGGQVDAGGRLRVSQITTLIDVKQTNNDAPLFYSRGVNGGGSQTYDKTKGGTDMAVAADGDYAIAQTKMFAPYYSGKGQLGEITFSNMVHDAGVIKRAGYFHNYGDTADSSAYDGFWFESDGSDYRIVCRNGANASEVFNVPQSEWNIDKFAGHDFSKFNVMVFQFLYLGGTRVLVGFFHQGAIRWAHEYVHAGAVANTFITYPQQPIRYEVISTGGAGGFTQICAQVASEGSIDEVGVQRSFNLGAADVNANVVGTFYALIGVRLKQDFRNIRVEEEAVSISALTNDAFCWELRLNPTVAGTFTYADVSNSSLQVAYGDVALNPSPNTVTGGQTLASGNGVGNSGITGILTSAIRIGSSLDKTSDTLVLCVTPLTANLDITASLNLKEFL